MKLPTKEDMIRSADEMRTCSKCKEVFHKCNDSVEFRARLRLIAQLNDVDLDTQFAQYLIMDHALGHPDNDDVQRFQDEIFAGDLT